MRLNRYEFLFFSFFLNLVFRPLLSIYHWIDSWWNLGVCLYAVHFITLTSTCQNNQIRLNQIVGRIIAKIWIWWCVLWQWTKSILHFSFFNIRYIRKENRKYQLNGFGLIWEWILLVHFFQNKRKKNRDRAYIYGSWFILRNSA